MSEDAFDEMVQQAETRVGRTLKDKWTLDQLLGVGGMASVYAATHRNQKRVAIKMLHPELSFNKAVRQRFLREGYVANSVQHAGAVSVFDDDVGEDGCAFLVMELLDGETLDARWERKAKRLPPGEVLALVDRVLDTLAAAHARGVVHRDIKPENLFFTREAQVKVLDFGIARVRELSGASKTQTGSLMGTPTFMPPEQARGRWEEVDAQSDLWAVGATMFTLLSGQFVHLASTVNEALVQAVTQPARSLGTVRPDLPSAVVGFIDRALAYDKDARWADALTMQNALREAYAALESDWDERTVLADAAAALPHSQLTAPPTAANTTALVSATSTPPLGRLRRSPGLLVASGGGIVLLTILLGTVFSRERSPAIDGAPQITVVATGFVEPKARTSVTIAAAPAVPPIAIDDLPSEAKAPARTAATGSARVGTQPGPSAKKPLSVVPTPAKPPAADPFSGRE